MLQGDSSLYSKVKSNLQKIVYTHAMDHSFKDLGLMKGR
jgi:hypothetical protein